MSQSIDAYTIVSSFTKNPKTRVKEISFGGGYRQMIVDGLNANEETWQIEFKPLLSGAATTLENILLNSTTASSNLISWTPPGAGSTSYFSAHDIQKTFVAPYWYILTTTLRKEFILG